MKAVIFALVLLLAGCAAQPVTPSPQQVAQQGPQRSFWLSLFGADDLDPR